ncbi:hypothetical protein [Hymenobacter glacieicola]|nr:hypothetical protein [Hymenobacter glacieicola]
MVRQDAGSDILTRSFPSPLVGALVLQFFHRLEEAEEWLRSCRQREIMP